MDLQYPRSDPKFTIYFEKKADKVKELINDLEVKKEKVSFDEEEEL